MARPLRIQYPGAVYHVMARGSHGQPIFADDPDRKRFLETLQEACQRTGWRIHAYVLMGNHYHLLVETPEGNLVPGMKWLQSTYTQRYNARKGFTRKSGSGLVAERKYHRDDTLGGRAIGDGPLHPRVASD